MTRPPKGPDAGQELWERVKGTVSPLKNKKGAKQTDQQTKTTIEQTQQDRPPSSPRPRAKPGRPATLAPYAEPEDRSSHKTIRRGRVEAQARIDLHGKNQDEAKTHLLHRLERHYEDRLRTILVITGRGEKDQGVLRTSLPGWLKEGGFHAVVSGFAPAHTRHGGKGAWYVFLRKDRKTIK